MRGLAIIFLLVFVGLAVAICLQNLDSANLTLLAWTVDTPVYLVAVIGYVVGMLTGWALAGFLKRSWRRAVDPQPV